MIFLKTKNVFFEPKSWLKNDIYWLLKSSCFELFGDGKYGLFLSQEVDGKMILTDYWKVLVLNFSAMGKTVFFEPKSWWKDNIYWLMKSSFFELFVNGWWKTMLTWSFWAFHNISGLGKYDFLCSVRRLVQCRNFVDCPI